MNNMTDAEVNEINNNISSVFKRVSKISKSRGLNLLPTNLKSLAGKLFEASVLASVCEKLFHEEKLTIVLNEGSKLILRQKGGWINKSKYPYFKVYKNGNLFGEIFTDVYFLTLSNHLKNSPNLLYGDHHELDIALLKPMGTTDKPKHSDIFLAIECKNRTLEKSIIKEILGIRRELSGLSKSIESTKFDTWPANKTIATPTSIYMLYCRKDSYNQSIIKNYDENCNQFGILLECHAMS